MKVEQCFCINGRPCELLTELNDGWEAYVTTTECGDVRRVFITKNKSVVFKIFAQIDDMDGSDKISFCITRANKQKETQ